MFLELITVIHTLWNANVDAYLRYLTSIEIKFPQRICYCKVPLPRILFFACFLNLHCPFFDGFVFFSTVIIHGYAFVSSCGQDSKVFHDFIFASSEEIVTRVVLWCHFLFLHF